MQQHNRMDGIGAERYDLYALILFSIRKNESWRYDISASVSELNDDWFLAAEGFQLLE